MEAAPAFRPISALFPLPGSDDSDARPPPVLIDTPPHKWHSASLSSQLDIGQGNAADRVLVRIALRMRAGEVGIGLISWTDHIRDLAPERLLEASDALQEAIFLVDPKQPARVCIRTGARDSAGKVLVEGVSVGDHPDLVKHHLPALFPHWYDTVDLGDGLLMRATVSGGTVCGATSCDNSDAVRRPRG